MDRRTSHPLTPPPAAHKHTDHRRTITCTEFYLCARHRRPIDKAKIQLYACVLYIFYDVVFVSFHFVRFRSMSNGISSRKTVGNICFHFRRCHFIFGLIVRPSSVTFNWKTKTKYYRLYVDINRSELTKKCDD